MSGEELESVRTKVAINRIATATYVERLSDLTLAATLGTYGVLLVIFGERLWSLSIYDTALAAPGGTTMWALTALGAGIGTAWATMTDHLRWLRFFTFVSAVWFAFFTLSFVYDLLDTGHPESVAASPMILVYGAIAVYTTIRSGLIVAVK